MATKLRCTRCGQSRSSACGFTACPLVETLALLDQRERALADGGRAPTGLTRELARRGVKRDLTRFAGRA